MVGKYTCREYLNHVVDEDTFVLSLAKEKTAKSELEELASVDRERYDRLSLRVKIEHYFHTNEKRKKSLDALAKKADLTAHDKQEVQNITAKYLQRENELVRLIDEYHQRYSVKYQAQYAEIKAELDALQSAPAFDVQDGTADEPDTPSDNAEALKTDGIIKRIKTSCPFPMLSYQVGVRYNEVRKASGIAFILLELMQQSVMKSDKLTDVLLRFGIPSDMHYIFAKELSSLISTDIVQTTVSVEYLERPEYFNQMIMEYFSLTEKGKKMFSEGAIPTGQEKIKTVSLFYKPATRKYEYVCQQPYAPLETSFLGEDFLDKIDFSVSDMEDYIRATKEKVGLKKEELVADVTYDEYKKLAVKPQENLAINILPTSVSFTFDNTDEQAFFAKYYSSALMSDGMLMKDNYKFAFPVATVDYEELNVDNIYIPADIKKQSARPCKLFINRGRVDLKRSDNGLSLIGKETLLDVLDENAEFALLDSAGCKYYSPLNVRFPCENFDDIFEMQVLVETVATSEAVHKLLCAIINECTELDFSSEIGQIILYAAAAENDFGLLRNFAAQKLLQKNNNEAKIELLLCINDVFAKCEKWPPYFGELADSLFVEETNNVSVSSVRVEYAVLLPLKRAMNMTDAEFIHRFTAGLRTTESAEIIFRALESIGVEEKLILQVANVVDPLMTQVLERTRIVQDTVIAESFSLLSHNLWTLCDMLGAEDLSAYSLKDDYNVDAFFNAFSTFEQCKKNVEKYRPYAKEQFAELDRYEAVFAPVNEVLSIERTASEHPENITIAYIDEQIARGRYNIVISNLLIKAQYDLRILLAADNVMQANELIDEAEKRKIIQRDEASDLHKLRMCRNGLQHPEARQIQYDKATLEGWKKLVFSLKGDK